MDLNPKILESLKTGDRVALRSPAGDEISGTICRDPAVPGVVFLESTDRAGSASVLPDGFRLEITPKNFLRSLRPTTNPESFRPKTPEEWSKIMASTRPGDQAVVKLSDGIKANGKVMIVSHRENHLVLSRPSASALIADRSNTVQVFSGDAPHAELELTLG